MTAGLGAIQALVLRIARWRSKRTGSTRSSCAAASAVIVRCAGASAYGEHGREIEPMTLARSRLKVELVRPARDTIPKRKHRTVLEGGVHENVLRVPGLRLPRPARLLL